MDKKAKDGHLHAVRLRINGVFKEHTFRFPSVHLGSVIDRLEKAFEGLIAGDVNVLVINFELYCYDCASTYVTCATPFEFTLKSLPKNISNPRDIARLFIKRISSVASFEVAIRAVLVGGVHFNEIARLN